VRENVAPRQVTRPKDSYDLKGIAERFLGFYVSNASLKGAMLEVGYEPVWQGPLNMGFRCGPKPRSPWEDQPHGPKVLGPTPIRPRASRKSGGRR